MAARWAVVLEHWCSAMTLTVWDTEDEARRYGEQYPARKSEWVRIERRDT